MLKTSSMDKLNSSSVGNELRPHYALPLRQLTFVNEQRFASPYPSPWRLGLNLMPFICVPFSLPDAAVPLPFADRQRERAIEHLRGMQKSNQILSGRC